VAPRRSALAGGHSHTRPAHTFTPHTFPQSPMPSNRPQRGSAIADGPGLRPQTPSSHRAKPQPSARAPAGAGRAQRGASSSLDTTHIPAELKAFERGAQRSAIGMENRATHGLLTPRHHTHWRGARRPRTWHRGDR